jgi:hypothetical protein
MRNRGVTSETVRKIVRRKDLMMRSSEKSFSVGEGEETRVRPRVQLAVRITKKVKYLELA